MSLTLTIQNLPQLQKEIAAYPQDIERIINNEFRATSIGLMSDAKRLAPVNEGALRQSINSSVSNLELRFGAYVDYAPFIEFGTKSFAAAYVSALPPDWQAFAAEFKGSAGGSFKELVEKITRWMALKGIPLEAAYPIAKKIVVNGIKAQPFLFPSFEKNKLELIRNLKAQLNAK